MTELVSNGTFDTDTTCWVDIAPSESDLSVVGGRLRVTQQNFTAGLLIGADSDCAITTVIGQRYRITADVFLEPGGDLDTFFVEVYDSTATTLAVDDDGNDVSLTGTSDGTVTSEFIANDTNTLVSLSGETTTETGGAYIEFDNVSVVAEAVTVSTTNGAGWGGLWPAEEWDWPPDDRPLVRFVDDDEDHNDGNLRVSSSVPQSQSVERVYSTPTPKTLSDNESSVKKRRVILDLLNDPRAR